MAEPVGRATGAENARRPLGLYVHVPFCTTRCGYCDFNTYTAVELGDEVRRDTFHDVLMREIRLAAAALGDGVRPVSSVFVGGGTPTLLGSSALVAILDGIRSEFGLTEDPEITTEANPDSVDESMLAELRAGGFTRVSFGMQSASERVLRVLDRTHTPGASAAVAATARLVGFEHVSLDLIYGTPGESDSDLRASVDAAIESGVDHISAYALIVEDGTPLARRIARGELPMPDDDVAADRYEIVDSLLRRAGFDWYEVSNWAQPGGECRHNLGYWHDDDWWGVGPGAHSHIDGERWWNVKHPRTYAVEVTAGRQPVAGRETLTHEQRSMERIMLGLRLAEGLPLEALTASARQRAERQAGDGLLSAAALGEGQLVLTDRGRLLADAVIRDLVA